MENNKKRISKSDSISLSDLDAYTDKIISNLGRTNQQGTRGNDFNPMVTTIPTAPTPPVQTRFAGTQFYDNTPSTYIAPAYGQLKDISIKRSNQAVSLNNAWEKTKSNFLSSMPDIQDEDYLKAKESFLQSMDAYDAKLNEGDWADQTTMVSSFVDELINKKGGKQFAGLTAAKENRRKELEESLKDYDAEKGTGGTTPEFINYLSTPIYDKPIYDKEGNIIGGNSFRYPTIQPAQNYAKQLNDFLNPAKGSVRLGEMKEVNGEMIQTYFDETGMLGKYGIKSTESYTKEQIANAVFSYLDTTNGNSYSQFIGKVREFNSPLSADALRTSIGELSKANPNNPSYEQLLNMTDEQLIEASKKTGLGAQLQANDYKQSLLKGAVAVHEYTKESMAFEDDSVTQAIAEAAGTFPYRSQGGENGNGKDITGYDENGNPLVADLPYSYGYTAMDLYNIADRESPDAIANTLNNINTQLPQLENKLKYLRTQKNYESSADFKATVQQKEKLDTQLKLLKNIQKTNFKELSDVSMQSSNIGLSTMVQVVKGQKGIQGKDTSFIATTLQNAIYAEIDKDPKTTAESVLKNAGLTSKLFTKDNTVYNNTNNKTNFNKFLSTDDDIKTEVDEAIIMNTVSKKGDPYINLGSYARTVAKEYTKLRTGKDRQGNSTYKPSITTSMGAFTLYGESAKHPEGQRFLNELKSIGDDVNSVPSSYMVFDPLNGSKKTLDTQLSEVLDMKKEDLYKAIKLKSLNLGSQQGTSGNGDLVYIAEYEFKEPSQANDKDAYEAVSNARKNLNSANSVLRFPITLGRNKHKDQGVKSSLLNIINTNDRTISGLDNVTRQQSMLVLSKIDGIDNAVDASYLYNLDGSGKDPNRQYRDLKLRGFDLRVTAHNNYGATTKEDKSFQMQVKDKNTGEYKYIAVDKNGQPAMVSQAQLNSGYTIKDFDTTEDIKAYMAEVYYRDIGRVGNSNFNTGGSRNPKYGTDRPSDKSRTYQTTLIRNGQEFKTNAYINPQNLQDIRGKVKMSGSAGIPYVNKEIAQNAINLANQYGLTVTGGLRTKEHAPGNSANNSAHFNGNALDFKMDNNARKLYRDIKTNPNLAQRLGIQFAHDGDHVHITFSSPKGNVNLQKNYKSNSVMRAIAQGESNNRNLGYHYKDTKSTSAYGKYGFTDQWINRMASYYRTTPDMIRKSPTLIDEYANTEYIRIANQEIKPFYSQLKEKLERYIPNFSQEDAIFIYHYGGIGRVKQLAKGQLSPNSVPAPQYNSLTFKDYVFNKRKYIS